MPGGRLAVGSSVDALVRLMQPLVDVATSVLHISDLHRTEDEPVPNEEILHALVADFATYGDDQVPKPEIVVVSGDVTQSADPDEYKEAATLIRSLMNELSLPLDRLVLVPGNHDVHWPTCDEMFSIRRSPPPKDVPRDLIIETPSKDWIFAASEASYQRRLQHFAAFYKDLTGRDYPLARATQYTIHEFPELQVAFAGLSSVDRNDNRRLAGSIHVAAVSEAATKLESFDGVRFAVWHHDLNWHGKATDSLEIESLRNISLRTFHLGLCGHSHRSAVHRTSYLEDIDFPVVTAGSVCAGPRTRPESTPRFYNVLEVHPDRVRAHLRARETRSSPWKAHAKYRDENSNWRPWRDIRYSARRTIQVSVPPVKPAATNTAVGVESAPVLRAPAPFAEQNARGMTRAGLSTGYVWTPIAERIDTDVVNIVLGPRGSGKTALLLSLCLEWRARSPKYQGDTRGALRRIGLMCPMSIADVTAFNNKGWMDQDERATLFSALIATLWAQELLSAIELAPHLFSTSTIAFPTTDACAATLARAWVHSDDNHVQSQALRQWLARLKADLVLALGLREDAERGRILAKCLRHPLTRGGPSALQDAAISLRTHDAYASTRWIVLFDEVEYLSEWQQRIVYDYLRHSSESVTTKIATLPYAHMQATRTASPPLVSGHEYQELALSLSSFASDGARTEFDDELPDFTTLAQGLWRARLRDSGVAHIELEQVWPEYEFEAVLAQIRPGTFTRETLEDELIGDLAGPAATRARSLKRRSSGDFGDQYWRKYQQPFRFRLAHRKLRGKPVPLFWGWRTLLRACDGNCRWFLQLADECWRLFWLKDGLRPLSASEQTLALTRWAKGMRAVCASLTRHGGELDQILNAIVTKLKTRLYESASLTVESASVKVRKLTIGQSEAVACGVAFGFLVPRIPAGSAEMLSYPTSAVDLRLGFPVAVAADLPLRSGPVLVAPDLRQVTFAWYHE